MTASASEESTANRDQEYDCADHPMPREVPLTVLSLELSENAACAQTRACVATAIPLGASRKIACGGDEGSVNPR